MEAAHPLKSYRSRAGLTQKQLGDQLGVTRETVARWETGVRRIDDALVQPISSATGIPTRELRPDLALIIGAAE